MELKERLILLADKYENPAFLDKDPSKFMHRYLKNSGENEDAQIVAFIAANLAFGRREQILSHVETILDMMKKAEKKPVQWILDGDFEIHFPKTANSFYRMYTFNDMNVFFKSLQKILRENTNLGSYFEKKWQKSCTQKNETIYLHQVLSAEFIEKCSLISVSKGAAAKKLNMFLRWMVRTSSPVDLGLWTWYDKSKLLLPLDTHVMQEAVRFGFLQQTPSGKIPGANLKTAISLTNVMQKYFPGDPTRADFALFGLGVDEERNKTEN
ncbi:TIGR02757 family protein [Treponema pectinovorum]|uniref:TIGR02757 family protein n=1 Tax=Treponema pectinovorum TaxID=164 RepID=UPI003D9069A1